MTILIEWMNSLCPFRKNNICLVYKPIFHLFQGTFFRHGKDIPKRFISKGVKLQGRVKEIDLDGIVYVQHIPILDLRLPWLKKPRTELLPMTLAFVDLTPNCKKWLEQNLLDTHIWFKVLRREKDQDQLQAALFHQKVFKIKVKVWSNCQPASHATISS